ncbi:UbiD family decarboxylase [Allokutzneria sp. A3M-2-11 16]|uniref:UbiD family decarboxylase n=1 Tax=Allokutzneria sp. A3M-2-11 16 TaxID=2962043 RepID=UPI0020B66AE1|nr:UbiD family decarboxylase [Allokutzneria sp. A3M-2-11 16]MCP3798319.1 UbiD family decarboxylase [Allokutzneria sp. A3M-2-11 16]
MSPNGISRRGLLWRGGLLAAGSVGASLAGITAQSAAAAPPKWDPHVADAKRRLGSLREYLDALKALGDLREIEREVDTHLEIGAITRRTTEINGPAVLFNRIKGHRKGFRVLGAPAALSSLPKARYARVALSLGFRPDTHPLAMVEALTRAHDLKPIEPVTVHSGPCQQNVLLGKDADLTKIPVPLLHNGDGGPYLNTWGTFVVGTPDGKWVNWSISRAMLVDGKRFSPLVIPFFQHLGVIAAQWAEQGKQAPFALVQGAEPGIPFASAMSLPDGVSEASFLGGYYGKPVELVRCKTVDLRVPATAEIVIEGHIDFEKTVPEGPMGEAPGYMSVHVRQMPTCTVTAITHRDNAILPVVTAGKAVDEDHTAVGVPASAIILNALRKNGIPATNAWMVPESALHVLAVTVPQDWPKRTGITSSRELTKRIAEIICDTRVVIWLSQVMVLDDDLDVTDHRDLMWGFATRTHPVKDQVVIPQRSFNTLMVCYGKEEQETYLAPLLAFDSLLPQGSERPRSTAFEANYPADLRKKILDNWVH